MTSSPVIMERLNAAILLVVAVCRLDGPKGAAKHAGASAMPSDSGTATAGPHTVH